MLRSNRTFDPAQSNRQFVLGLSDYAALVLLPRLTARLDEEAPAVSLIVRNTSHDVGVQMLEDGSVELVAGNFPKPPAHVKEDLLYEEDFVCASRKDHPTLTEPTDLEHYLSLRHLQVSTKGETHGYVDAVLAENRLQRNVAVTVGHFLMAPLLAGSSDLVATEPRRLFGPLADRFALQLFAPPIEIPAFRVVQAWHTRYDADPAHEWLRRVLKEVGQEV